VTYEYSPKPKKTGRPKLPEEEAKSVFISPVRCNMEDRELIYRAAKASGQSVSTWIRNILVEAAANQAKPKPY